jgi:uncharacterized lipoprotein YajG
MNAVRSAGCTIIALMLLGGCATTREQSAVARSDAPVAQASNVLDNAYINRVEREARKDNVDVQWVNPPTKRDDSDTSPSKPR